MDLQTFSDTYNRIEEETRRAFLGQDDVLDSVLVAVFARGNVLIEGVPGVGKTLLVRVLGQVLGCHFRRVQFTPDLMPSDVTGSTTYNAQKDAFEFKHLALELTVDFEAHRLVGTATWTVAITASGTAELVLDTSSDLT